MIYSLRKSLTTQHFLLSQQEIIDLKVKSNSMAVFFFCCFVIFKQIHSCRPFRYKLKPESSENKNNRGSGNNWEQFKVFEKRKN